MAKYIYEGNRDPNNTSTRLEYEGQVVSIGQPVELESAVAHRLSSYVLLTNKNGNEVTPDGPIEDGSEPLDPSTTTTDTVAPSIDADATEPLVSEQSEPTGNVANKTGSSKKS